jgi:hypothetical protein
MVSIIKEVKVKFIKIIENFIKVNFFISMRYLVINYLMKIMITFIAIIVKVAIMVEKLRRFTVIMFILEMFIILFNFIKKEIIAIIFNYFK